MADQDPIMLPPDRVFGALQHERTALAWERTAIAMMVAGVILTRFTALSMHFGFGAVGVTQTLGGVWLLLWASKHNEHLHSAATPASEVPQVQLTRLVGLGAVVFSSAALSLAVLAAVT